MGLFGNIGDFIGATAGEIGRHPWQAAGAALGVPGFDPAIGGLLNNRPGGALLSPTGNFTSSSWNDMYQNNPGAASGLNMFHGINAAADVVAPMMAGGFASGAFGGSGSGLGNMFGSGSSGASLGPSGIDGSGPLFGVGSGMGGAMPGAAAPTLASSNPYMSAFGGTSMAYPFSAPMSAGAINPQILQQGLGLMQQGQQHQQQSVGPSPQLAFGNPVMRGASPPLGPSMSYATFGGAGAQVSPLSQMLAMRGGM
jgi:hypothetical protein